MPYLSFGLVCTASEAALITTGCRGSACTLLQCQHAESNILSGLIQTASRAQRDQSPLFAGS